MGVESCHAAVKLQHQQPPSMSPQLWQDKQNTKKFPAVGTSSCGHRHSETSKETYPNHDPDPRQQQADSLGLCLFTDQRQMQTGPNTGPIGPFPLNNDSPGDASTLLTGLSPDSWHVGSGLCSVRSPHHERQSSKRKLRRARRHEERSAWPPSSSIKSNLNN